MKLTKLSSGIVVLFAGLGLARFSNDLTTSTPDTTASLPRPSTEKPEDCDMKLHFDHLCKCDTGESTDMVCDIMPTCKQCGIPCPERFDCDHRRVFPMKPCYEKWGFDRLCKCDTGESKATRCFTVPSCKECNIPCPEGSDCDHGHEPLELGF